MCVCVCDNDNADKQKCDFENETYNAVHIYE